MFSQNQVLRWGVPGWVTIISGLLLAYVQGAVADTWKIATPRFLVDTEPLALAILTAGAGIPIGFVVYQVYFWFRWNRPLAHKDLYFLLRGRRRDIADTVAGIERDVLHRGQEWRKRLMREFDSDHRAAWHYIDSLLVEVATHKSEWRLVAERDRYLRDIMHCLGASQLGLVLGAALYLSLVRAWPQSCRDWLAMGLASAILLALFYSFENNRRNVRDNLVVFENYWLHHYLDMVKHYQRDGVPGDPGKSSAWADAERDVGR